MVFTPLVSLKVSVTGSNNGLRDRVSLTYHHLPISASHPLDGAALCSFCITDGLNHRHTIYTASGFQRAQVYIM